MVSVFCLNTMKKLLLLTAVACCAPVVSPVARAREQAVNVYASHVSLSFPEPDEEVGPFSGNRDAMEVTLGFRAPDGYQFLPNEGKFRIWVKDAAGGTRHAELDSFLTRISSSGTSAKCPVRMQERLPFPLELDGAVRMKVAEGIQVLPAQEFEARKGVKFKAEGLEITVEDVMGQGKEFSKIKLGFQDTLDVKEITLTDEQGGRLDVQAVSKGSNCVTGVPSSCVYTYVVKKMPSRMKASVVVHKGAETLVVPVKLTVDLNAPSMQAADGGGQ